MAVPQEILENLGRMEPIASPRIIRRKAVPPTQILRIRDSPEYARYVVEKIIERLPHKQAVDPCDPDFYSNRQWLGDSYLQTLDQNITGGAISFLTRTTGGIKLVWSPKKVTGLAGKVMSYREGTDNHQILNVTMSTRDAKVVVQTVASAKLSWGLYGEQGTFLRSTEREMNETKYFATIWLYELYVRDEFRMKEILAHEFAHVCANLLTHRGSEEAKNKANGHLKNHSTRTHAKDWRDWVQIIAYQMGITESTVNHCYPVSRSYYWLCSNMKCGKEYFRFLCRGVFLESGVCKRCGATLLQLSGTGVGDEHLREFIDKTIELHGRIQANKLRGIS